MLGIALFASLLVVVAPKPAAPKTAAPQTKDAAALPPGLVLVKGGKTKIGSTVDEVEKLVLAREELRNVLAAQTPQHVHPVENFLLMPTEVTNEQYAEYVKATSAKPPRSWGVKALQEGQANFLEEQGKAKQEARAAGKPFETKVFDPEAWWEANWKDAKWDIPQTELTNPVVFVTYAEAQRYARWAGLRLMTEFEYQRAARGDSARQYPWGDEWDDKKFCQSLHIGRDISAPVGSYPEGAVDGIFDLAGNVWEWTASPFTEYPGYKQLRFTDKKKRAIECLAPFDPNQRVAVSGSYQMDKVGVRIPTRMNTDRTQSTSAMGFRCAAYPEPGVDAAQWIIDQDLKISVMGPDTTLTPKDRVSTLRRWSTGTASSQVANYAVITGYEHVLLCPRTEVRANTTSDLAQTSAKDGPIFLGFIDVPRPMTRPELDAGTYFVAWRAAGKLSEAKEEEKQGIALATQEPEPMSFETIPGFTAEKDCFLFYSSDGTPQVAIEAPPVVSDRSGRSSVKIEPWVAPDPKSLPKDAPPPTPVDTLRFTLPVTSATSKAKGLVFDLAIQVAPGTYDASWK